MSKRKILGTIGRTLAYTEPTMSMRVRSLLSAISGVAAASRTNTLVRSASFWAERWELAWASKAVTSS
jgi:hypothetical protein